MFIFPHAVHRAITMTDAAAPVFEVHGIESIPDADRYAS
jgi:hypothetical protein